MELSTKQLAGLLGGEIEGDENVVLNNIAKIETAGPKDLAFLSNPKYESFVYESDAGAILVKRDFRITKPVKTTLIRVDDPYLAFTMILKQYEQAARDNKNGIEQPSFCHETAKVGKNIYRGAFSYIGAHSELADNVKLYPNSFIGENVRIGENTVIYPGVKVQDHCIIGRNVVIHSGAVIGSDGFGFAPREDGSYDSIPQLGNVVLEDEVNIGANTVVDRATLPGESTVVEKGAKLDNLIQIAHNVRIGESTVMAAQTGVSGSSKVGKYCMMGGQVGIAGHLEIADNTGIGAQAGIAKSVKKKGTKIIGSPAISVMDYFKSYTVFTTLPEMSRRLKQLEEKVLNLPEFSDKE